MDIPGIDGFIRHMPDYEETQVKRIVLRLPLFAVIFFLIQFLLVNAVSIIIIPVEPYIPIILDLVFIFMGTLVAQVGFRAKSRLLNEDPERDYQRVVKPVLGGISMVFSAMMRSYIPMLFPASPLAVKLSSPMLSNELGTPFIVFRLILGAAFLIIGARTAYRAVMTFGIDTASLVYVYYPDEAEVVDHEIYSVIRHPMYLAVYLVAFGGLLFRFSPYAIITFTITALSFYRHIFLVEERELIERFGDLYVDYSNKVPALIARPKDWGEYFKFLIDR